MLTLHGNKSTFLLFKNKNIIIIIIIITSNLADKVVLRPTQFAKQVFPQTFHTLISRVSETVVVSTPLLQICLSSGSMS